MQSSTKTQLNLFAISGLVICILVIAIPAGADSLDDAARAYQSGDYKKAHELLKPLARDGNAIAQHNVGLMYKNGQGVTRNYAEAAKWFRKAADQGVASSQYNLAIMYDSGRGVSRDYATAAKWYRKAAEQGDPASQYNLGGMYQYGEGVPQDLKEAIEWYRKAAEQGDALAQKSLGILYGQGEGISKNMVQAYKWINLAATRFPPGKARNEVDSILRTFRKEMTSAQITQAEKLIKEWNVQHKRK